MPSNLGQSLLIPARGGGAWTPRQLSGLAIWADPSQETASDATAVASTFDAAGAGIPLTQGTAANRPLLKTAVLGGKNAYRYDGTNDGFVVSPSLDCSGGPVTIFVVTGRVTNTTDAVIVETSADFNSNTGTVLLSFGSATDNYTRVAAKGTTGVQLVDFVGKLGTGPDVVTATFDLARNEYEAYLWQNGVLNPTAQSVGLNNAAGLAANQPLNVGARAGGSAFPFAGDMGDFILVRGAVVGNDLKRAEKYLRLKYGLTDYARVLVCLGDSYTYGSGGTAGQPYPKLAADNLSGLTAITNLGVIGATAVSANTLMTQWGDALHQTVYPNETLVVWAGSNDLRAGGTGATLLTNLATLVANRRAAGWTNIVTLTVLPRSDAGVPGGYETERSTANTAIVANAGHVYGDSIANVAGDNRIGDSGDSNDTTYYNADKIHLNTTGYGIVRDVVLATGAIS